MGIYTSNLHGDVSQIIAYGQKSLAKYGFDAFGNENSAANTVHNPFGYCGEYRDEETGLIYLRARYYDPNAGRFISEDPIKDGVNWYVYCGNNPVNFVDPWGLFGKNMKLKYGSWNSCDVMILQQRLNDLGYTDANGNSLLVDGNFGSNTEYAVNRYKSDNLLSNDGEYHGVVGATTWAHLGLTFDNDFEVGASSSGEIVAYGFYASANGPNLNRGLNLFDAEAGLTKILDDYKYARWNVALCSASAKAGIGLQYVGVDILASTVSAEGSVKIPIPFIEKNLIISGEGHIGAIGVQTYWDAEEARIKVGIAAVVGAGVSLGLEDR